MLEMVSRRAFAGLVLSSVFLLGSLCASVTVAQPLLVGNEFQVNAFSTGSHFLSKIAIAPDGGFIVVWESFNGGAVPPPHGTQGDIFARRFDSSGVPMGVDLLVNSFTTTDQSWPAVAIDGSGQAVVVWESVHLNQADVFGQRIDATGALVGGEFQINTTTHLRQLDPQVASADNGTFVVVWTDTTYPGDDVRGRLFDASGAPLTGELQLSGEISLATVDDVEMDAEGEFIVSWTSSIGNERGVFARRFDSTGWPLGPAHQVNVSTVGQQSDSDLALAPDGGFIMVWNDDQGLSGSGQRVVGRRFDSADNPLAGEFRVFDNSNYSQTRPAVDAAADGRFVVVWEDGRHSFGSTGSARTSPVARRFDNTAMPIGDPFVVNDNTTGTLLVPDVAMDDEGRFVVTWSSFILDGVSLGIKAREYEIGDTTLVAQWPLDEGMGTTTASTFGTGLDGSLEDTTSWTLGQQGTGVFLDGTNDFIRIDDTGSDSELDVTDALTIALWVRPDEVDGTTQSLVSKDNAYELEFGKLGADVLDLRLANFVAGTAPTTLEEGVWQHVAVTWDGSDVAFYYNGLLDGNDVAGGFDQMLVPNDEDLGFGARPALNSVGGPIFHFTGALDEVHLYNRALDGNEIAQLVLETLSDVVPPARSDLLPMANQPLGTTSVSLEVTTDENATCRFDTSLGIPFDDMSDAFTITGGTGHSAALPVSDGQLYNIAVRCRDALGNINGEDALIAFAVGEVDLCSDLVSTWTLDEGSGCVAADSHGGNDADLGPNCSANAPLWGVGYDGSGASLTFDGNDDRVTVATPTGLSSLSEITISAWIRHGANGTFRSIVDRRDSNADGFDLYLSNASKLFMRINGFTLQGSTTLDDGAWHHVVGVYDGSAIDLYVDGVLDAQASAGSTTIDVTGSLFLGHNFDSSNFTLEGDLDDVAIYGRGLSDLEVFDLFLDGVASCGSP